MSPNPNPKVDMIADTLRQRISAGEFGTAGRLPSLRMLAAQFDTTHETMNKVIQRLQAEGLLLSLGRAGVFVKSPQSPIPGITRNFAEYLKEQDQIPVEEDISAPAIVPAPAEVVEALGVDEGAPVVRRYRRQGALQGMSIVPYRLAETFYPVELAGGAILERMQEDTSFDVLAAIQKTYGKEIKRVREDVVGRLPTSHEQELLNIVRNAPVLEVLRTNYAADDDDFVIMCNRIIFVASYFKLSYAYTPYWVNQ